MKSRMLIELAIATLITMSSTVYCQKIAKIEDLGSRVEKLWEVNIPIQPNRQGSLMYAVLTTGIAVLSPEGKTIYCYDYNNGQLRWQAPAIQINSSNGAIYSTADGEFLLLRYPHNEVEITTAIYTNDGQLLWSALYEALFSISPSGNYLISERRLSGGSMPLTVLDLTSGNRLWQIDPPKSYGHWEAASSKDDKIVYYNGGALKLFQLSDGKLLWERNVEFDPRTDDGSVHISRMGNVISYDATIGILRNKKQVTHVFNDEGELLWQRTRPNIHGKSNGGRIKGISDGGEYIAIKDGSRFSVYDIKKEQELWTLTEAGLSSIRIFTKEVLIFPPKPQETRSITLREDGTIQNRHTLNQFIDFRCGKESGLISKKESTCELAPIIVSKTDGQFVLSKVNVDFSAIK